MCGNAQPAQKDVSAGSSPDRRWLVPRLLDVPTFSDERGALSVIESPFCPFPITRVYYLYGADSVRERGGHAHKALAQMMISVSGTTQIALDDGLGMRRDFMLETASTALYVPPAHFRTLTIAAGAVCLVLASLPYDEDDYFRDYKEFVTWKQSHS